MQGLQAKDLSASFFWLRAHNFSVFGSTPFQAGIRQLFSAKQLW